MSAWPRLIMGDRPEGGYRCVHLSVRVALGRALRRESRSHKADQEGKNVHLKPDGTRAPSFLGSITLKK